MGIMDMGMGIGGTIVAGVTRCTGAASGTTPASTAATTYTTCTTRIPRAVSTARRTRPIIRRATRLTTPRIGRRTTGDTR